MKKILALILAAVMMLSMCSFAAAEEPVKLVWFMYTASEMPIDWPEVEEALNAYSAEKIGVVCEYKYMDESQVAIATQTGEYFDIAFTCDWWNDYATNVAAGMFRDITADLDNYPALKDSIVDLAWEGVKVNGGIYAIPHMKDIGYEVFWILNTDYFINQKGFEVDQYISFEGIEPYFEAYKADHPDDYPFKMSKGGITSWKNCLVDWLNMDYLIGLEWEAQGTEDEHTVKSALEIPAFVNRLKKIHEWYQKGYINPDAAVTDSMPRAQAGVVQSGQGWFGAETVWANVIKQPIYISRYDGAFLSTSSIRGSMTAISSFSEHPQEALKLVELMNTDPWYRETARYGIEGKHYTRNDDGTVTRTELGSSNMGVQAYAQGHYTLGALEASPFPEVPTDIHQWEKTMANYANATLSAAMGFTPDLTPVETQCLALKAVIEEYMPELQTGTSDPDVVIPEMLARMNEVGLQDIIAEVQAQLNAFIGK
ncbi:MAG: ABC transporter substrate-binding protein [Clostridia bacterium]|nr:ABC transporter substrate-binding protein [Clostridia bacterium]